MTLLRPIHVSDSFYEKYRKLEVCRLKAEGLRLKDEKDQNMYRYKKIFSVNLIAIFGMMLPIGYYFVNSIPPDAGMVGFQAILFGSLLPSSLVIFLSSFVNLLYSINPFNPVNSINHIYSQLATRNLISEDRKQRSDAR